MRTHLDALTLFRQAAEKYQIHISVLVAETGLWAHPDVYRQLLR